MIVVLGAFGWQALLPVLSAAGWQIPTPRPKFGHGVQVPLAGPAPLTLLGCYHVSQQNTFTGKLTPAMVEAVLTDAKHLAGLELDAPHLDRRPTADHSSRPVPACCPG